jgi:hypothetical protein
MTNSDIDFSEFNLSDDEIQIIQSGEQLPESLFGDSGFVTTDCSVVFDGHSLIMANK